MTPIYLPLRLLLLITPLATAIPTSSLFARQSDSDTCPSQQSACPSSLPSGFCCPDNARCVPLAGNTTVLCCPKDNNNECEKITPITCNIDQQDPEKNPRAPIKTSVFDVELETCGDGTCCPFGFSCHEGRECRMNEDQDQKPGEEEPSESSTSSAELEEPTSSSGSEPTSSEATETPDSLPSDEDDSEGEASSSGPDTTTIIGGVVGGIAALLALAIILFVCARRRAARRTPNSSSTTSPASSRPGSSRPTQHARNFSSTSNSSGPRGNIISDPIMQQNSYRTDFILKNPGTSSVASTPQQPASHLRNSVHPHISTVQPYDPNDPFVTPSPSARESTCSADDRPGSRGSRRLAPIRGMKAPRTPRQQPSCESINVFADPGTVERRDRYSMGTTVSGLMIGLRGEQPAPAPLSRGDASGRLYVPGTTPRI